MPVVPTGAPAWVRTNDFTTYGGNLNKTNYLLKGVVDPETDVSAEQFSRMAADLAAVMRVAPFAVVVLTMNDTAPAAPTINRVNMMTGTRNTSYAGNAAPTGFPSAARVGTGVCTVTFSSSYLDEFSVSGSLSIQCPQAQISGSNASVYCNVTRDSATQLTIRTWNDVAAAVADQQITLVVWSGA